VGSNSGSISYSYATGNVTSGSNAGGLVGTNYGSTITNCYATGNVTASRNDVSSDIGGLVGWNSNNSTISGSYATGNVTGNSDAVGGLVGLNHSAISNSYATGNATGNTTSSSGIGTLVGSTTQNSTITNSYATGNVIGYAHCQLAPDGNGSNNSSFYNKDVCKLQMFYNEDGRTTAEMKTKSTYIDWDFENIWNIGNLNNGYPVLQWQLQGKAIASYIPPQAYTGSAIQPNFTVTYDNTALTEGSHYTVIYSNNKNAGTAKITITGIGSYASASTEAYFAITPKPLTITGVTAINRTFDGSTSVELTGGVLNGIVSGDVVNFTLGNGTIDNAGIGSKAVTTNITLTGANASNYTLTQPTDITVEINEYEYTKIIANRTSQIIGNINVHTITNTIQLSNLPQNAKIEVYNLQGKRIYSTNSGNSKILRIPVQTRGMYIVKVY